MLRIIVPVYSFCRNHVVVAHKSRWLNSLSIQGFSLLLGHNSSGTQDSEFNDIHLYGDRRIKISLQALLGISIMALTSMLAEAQPGGQGQGENQEQSLDNRMHDDSVGERMGMMNEERRKHMEMMQGMTEQMMENAEQESHEH